VVCARLPNLAVENELDGHQREDSPMDPEVELPCDHNVEEHGSLVVDHSDCEKGLVPSSVSEVDLVREVMLIVLDFEAH